MASRGPAGCRPRASRVDPHTEVAQRVRSSRKPGQHHTRCPRDARAEQRLLVPDAARRLRVVHGLLYPHGHRGFGVGDRTLPNSDMPRQEVAEVLGPVAPPTPLVRRNERWTAWAISAYRTRAPAMNSWRRSHRWVVPSEKLAGARALGPSARDARALASECWSGQRSCTARARVWRRVDRVTGRATHR